MSDEFACLENLASLKSGIEAVTGESYEDLTAGVQALKNGYGQSGGNDSTFKGFIERTEKTPTLPSDLTKIGGYAFYNYSALAITSLPSGITDIGAYAFFGCSNIALTALPNGVKTISGNAFQGCSKLALTSLPSELTSIGPGGFQNCTKLAITSLPSELTSISNAAFRGCTNLKTITFNSTPTLALGTAVFYDCSNLTDIYVPWAEGEVANAPWGATNATIHYNSEV